MSLSLKAEMPEKYRNRIAKYIDFIAFNRCGWIIPAAMAAIFTFMILLGMTSIFGTNNKYFIYIDSITLINFGFIFLLYKKHRILKADDLNKPQILVQNATAGSIILYGALINAFDTSSSVGYSTFVVCFLLVGGLLYIKTRTLIMMSLCSILIQYVAGLFVARSFGISYYILEVVLFLAVLFISLAINSANVSLLVKTFVFEQSLEEKVEERTKQLSEETKRAQQADNLKTVFLANMSHEIRTPLNGILGFAHLLKDEDLDLSLRRKYLNTIIKSGDSLLEILNGIIEVSRIESGVCEVDIEDFCLNDVIQDVLNVFQSNSKIFSSELTLVNFAEGHAPVSIKSDRLKITQIITNLINNAIKYSDSGMIKVGFNRIEKDTIEIYVEDKGRGLSKKEQHMIFGRFQQANQNTYGSRDGVGLGLTIVKGYAEILKGRIVVDSEVGKGSLFKLLIPMNFYAE